MTTSGRFAKLLNLLRFRLSAERRDPTGADPIDPSKFNIPVEYFEQKPNDLPFDTDEFARLVRSRSPSAMKILAARLAKSPSITP